MNRRSAVLNCQATVDYEKLLDDDTSSQDHQASIS